MVGIATGGPFGTVTNVTSSASVAIIGANTNRNALMFINSSSTVTVYVVPANLTAVVGTGIPLLPQGNYTFASTQLGPVGFGGGWNAIAGSGSASVLVLEFFGA